MNLDIHHSFVWLYHELFNQHAIGNEFLTGWYCPLEYVLCLEYLHIEVCIILLQIAFLLFLFNITIRYILF